jgi:hypothetical protein
MMRAGREGRIEIRSDNQRKGGTLEVPLRWFQLRCASNIVVYRDARNAVTSIM